MVYVPWARTKDLLYSTPYAANAVKFIKRKGDPFEFKGLDSLKGKRVGTVRGYGYGDAFLGSTAFTRKEVVDVLTNVKKLIGERIDLTLEDEIVAKSIIAKENPNHKAIIEAFNAGYETIKSNGTLAAILKKYNLSK